MAVLSNTMLQGTAAISDDAGSDALIQKSIRFNDDDSPYLQRTFGNGNARRYTWSGWIKRGESGSGGCFFSAGTGGTDPRTDWQFINDSLYIGFNPTGSSWIEYQTNRKFRDHSAWLHLCVIVNTNDPVSADRIKIYINGDREYSFSSSTSISAGTELKLNSALSHSLGRYEASDSNYFDGQLADVYFLDGELVHPSAFGEKDSTGVWNPKNPYDDNGKFKLRTPNNGTTWSTYLTGVRGGSAETVTTPAGTFNHSLGIYGRILHSSGDESTLNFNPPGDGITGQKVRLYCYQPQGTSGSRNRLSINGGEFREDVLWAGVGANADGWTKEIEIPGGVLTSLSLKLTYAGNSSQTIWAIEIDGVILVDGWTDHPTRKTNLYGTTWSAGTTAGGPYENNATKWGWPTAFNGYMATDSNLEVEANSNSPAYKLTLTNQPAWETSIALWCRADSDNPNSTFKVNNVDQKANIPDGTTFSAGLVKVICTGISSPLTSIEVGLTSGSTFVSVTAVEIDGHILRDDAIDNSFYLKFNDTSTNDTLGKDNLNGKIADASAGTKPLLTTTDDYGETLGSGFETDPNQSNLVLYLPLNSDNGVADKHKDVYSSSGHNNISMTDGNSGSYTTLNDSTQSRFYGSSRLFAGDNSTGDVIRFTATSDTELDGQFCIEFWGRCTSGATTNTVMQDSNGVIIGHGSSFGMGIYDPNTVIAAASTNTKGIQNQWHHYAFTRQSDNKIRIWQDGVLKDTSSGTSTATYFASGATVGIGGYNSNGQYGWNGNLQELKIYKGTAKYTSTFMPPTRNDWTVNNINAYDGRNPLANATGGLPILATTDTYGAVKGSGYRADSNKSNLVFAMTGEGSIADVSHVSDLRNSGSAKTITVSGDNAISTNSSMYYGSAVSFDKASDVMSVDGGSDFVFGTGDFTIEFWVNIISSENSTYPGFIQFSDASTGYKNTQTDTVAIYFQGNLGKMYVADGSHLGSKAHDWNTGWHHWACCRTGGYTKLYVDGKQILSVSDTRNYSGQYMGIGTYYDMAYEWEGYMQDLRVYKGVAKYTSNFTVSGNAIEAKGIDSCVDSPSTGGTDTGIGGEVQGNYATLNPLELTYGAMTFAQGNLKATANANWCASVASIHPKSGKFYWEVIPSTANSYIGVQAEGSSNSAQNPQNNAGNLIYYGGDGKRKTATTYTAYGDAYGLGDVIGVALDLDSSPQTVTYYKNNTSQGTLNLSLATGIENSYVRPAFYVYNAAIEVNFGQRAFKYTAPAGFKCLCTKNLDDVFSGDELNNPSKYFDILTYSGLGAAQTITGLNFQPELIWLKNYSGGSTSHSVYDTANGQGSNGYYRIEPDTQDSQADESNLTAITSDGFTVTSAGGYTNQLGGKHVAFCWDAGTAAATASTDGSITPSAQWVNATAGFSISKYTGTGSTATIGHALGAKPHFTITKSENRSDENWFVYHIDNDDAEKTVYLDLNSAAGDNSAYWNDTPPTNTLITVGTHNGLNGSSDTYVTYAWTPIPGYSHFGTYEGNGSTTGPFVYTGFSPHWILFKNIDSGEHWQLMENTIDTTNPVSSAFYANLQNAQETNAAFDVDFLSNGFKVRNTNSTMNTSGETYVYACFARNPFKTARAR